MPSWNHQKTEGSRPQRATRYMPILSHGGCFVINVLANVGSLAGRCVVGSFCIGREMLSR
eukprot:1853837-Pyramimonas_sp.AAC.1